ncbi:synaptogenesis protein syg-2-like [Saccostrea cucullata]|uniref:synaptogenesis protein syg-2-like n=1 Tax=Saccostrea cuccullata TaxID=36930 RepID=UPI002ED192A8
MFYFYSTAIPGPPTIVGDFERNEGETATLTCSSVGGDPLPVVEWYKNYELVDPGSSSTGNGDGVYLNGSQKVTYNNYTFTVSRFDNFVAYICRVKNSAISNDLTRSWIISVYVLAQQPVISGPEPAIKDALVADNVYKYTCEVNSCLPVPQILWKLGRSLSNSVEFHDGISESTFTNVDSTLGKISNLNWIPAIDDNDNGKNLYCETVQTTAGGSSTRKSSFVPINVIAIPGSPSINGDSEINEGETATLSCSSIGGNPRPSVEWYKNNQLVDPGSSSTGNGDGVYVYGSQNVTYNNYTFTVSRYDNLVSFICRVKNSAMSKNLTRSWTFSVYVLAQQPVIDRTKPDITNVFVADNAYKYTCISKNGRPAPKIRWRLGINLSNSVELYEGISESTSNNDDSTRTKISNLSWVPTNDDNGKNLYCETIQSTASGSSTRRYSFVSIYVFASNHAIKNKTNTVFSPAFYGVTTILFLSIFLNIFFIVRNVRKTGKSSEKKKKHQNSMNVENRSVNEMVEDNVGYQELGEMSPPAIYEKVDRVEDIERFQIDVMMGGENFRVLVTPGIVEMLNSSDRFIELVHVRYPSVRQVWINIVKKEIESKKTKETSVTSKMEKGNNTECNKTNEKSVNSECNKANEKSVNSECNKANEKSVTNKAGERKR